MPNQRRRVLLADDHGLVSAGVRQLLMTHYDVVGEVPDGQALVEMAQKTVPDLILADISMPRLDGIEAARRLRQALPDVPVMILSMHDDAGHVKAAFEAGVMGYLVKSSAPRELFKAIEEVLAGRVYVTPTVATQVMGSLRAVDRPAPPRTATTDAPTEPIGPVEKLTRREIEVIGLVGEGLDNGEIAARMFIAEVTVRTHYRRALRKLGLKNRVEVARYALDQGWAMLDTR